MKIYGKEIFVSEDKFFTTKSKSKSYAALKLIEELYKDGKLNDFLGVEIRQFSRKAINKDKRMMQQQEFAKDKQEKKRK